MICHCCCCCLSVSCFQPADACRVSQCDVFGSTDDDVSEARTLWPQLASHTQKITFKATAEKVRKVSSDYVSFLRFEEVMKQKTREHNFNNKHLKIAWEKEIVVLL